MTGPDDVNGLKKQKKLSYACKAQYATAQSFILQRRYHQYLAHGCIDGVGAYLSSIKVYKRRREGRIIAMVHSRKESVMQT